MGSLTFEPRISLSLWLLLAAAASSFLTWYAVTSRHRLFGRQRTVVLGLMGVVAAIPLLILLNPTWRKLLPPTGDPPRITILLDESASMTMSDEADGATRFEAAKRQAERIQEELGDDFDVRCFAFDGDVSSGTPEVPGKGNAATLTDIAGALDAAIEHPRAEGEAIVLLSDGVDNARPDAAALRRVASNAEASAVPIYTRTFGRESTIVHDAEIQLDSSRELAFINQTVPLTATVKQRGYDGRKAEITLSRNGEEIERREVVLDSDRTTGSATASTTFDVMESEPGSSRYDVSTTVFRDEATAVNNQASFLLRTTTTPIRLLLLEGKPYWDAKFLIRTLTLDPLVELDAIVRLTDERLMRRRVSHSPTGDEADGNTTAADETASEETAIVMSDLEEILLDPEELASYQIIVLGRGMEGFLTDGVVRNLQDWLSRGDGALICFRGAPQSQMSNRLERLMPVAWTPTPEQRFRVQWTEAGRSLGFLPTNRWGADVLRDLPSLSAVASAAPRTNWAVTIASTESGGDDDPVMSYHRVGNGRVVVLQGAGMWRWAFLPPTHDALDSLYGTLWKSMIRWLVASVGFLPGQTYALQSDKVAYHTQESVVLSFMSRDAATGLTPEIVLRSDQTDFEERTVSAVPIPESSGQFRIPFGRLPEGRYTASLQEEVPAPSESPDVDAGVVEFEVRDYLQERLDVAARPSTMSEIARLSGGDVLGEKLTDELSKNFTDHLTRMRPERVAKTPAWDSLAMLLTAFAAFGVCWAVRRRNGLT